MGCRDIQEYKDRREGRDKSMWSRLRSIRVRVDGVEMVYIRVLHRKTKREDSPEDKIQDYDPVERDSEQEETRVP